MRTSIAARFTAGTWLAASYSGVLAEATKVDAVASAASGAASAVPLADHSVAIALVMGCAFVMLVGFVAVLLLMLQSRGDTRSRRWRLSDALSEDVAYTDEAGHSVTLLTASSSRLIALLGLIVVLTMFMAMGLMGVYAMATGKAVGTLLDTMREMLLGGAGLFIPYLANQVRAGLEKKAASSTTTGTTDKPAAPVLPLPDIPAGTKID